MPSSVQGVLPPMEVNRADSGGESGVKPFDAAPERPPDLPDISLEMAKAQIGGAVKTTLRRTGSLLKEFGDSGQVSRVCDGEVPSILGRIWQRPNTRRELVLALAEESGLFRVRTEIVEREDRERSA